uniref:Uncharacterized protein n=1 Tax=Globisporangium ultimum (strain ATCC 200006 / CBS 805.95 / DAOM BR144) TaxID=431595 RepID=K3X889_GLOUD
MATEVQDTISPNDVNVVGVKAHKKEAPQSSYKVLCCGNSARDLLVIPLCLIGVYVLTGILFALCIHAVIQTDDTSTALWVFFGIYVTFIVMLGIVLGTTAYEKNMLKKIEEAEASLN